MRRRSGGGIGKIGGIMDDALAQNQLAEGIRPHRAIALWPDVVGEHLAAVSTAEAVRGGVLFIRARSGTWANELTFHTADILTRLNARLGGRVLTDIHVKAGGRGPRKKTSTPQVIEAVPNEDDLSDPRIDGPARGMFEGGEQSDATPEERILAVRARAARALAWKRAQGWIACPRCNSLSPPEAGPTGQVKPGRTPGWCRLCRQEPRPYG